MSTELGKTKPEDRGEGMFEDGDHTEEDGNARLRGELTDPSESRQLFSDVGERIQEMAGNEDPEGIDTRTQTESAPPNENLIADRFDQIQSRGKENMPSSQTVEQNSARARERDHAHETQPLIPDDAFGQPQQSIGVPVTRAAPAPPNEISPYQGEDGELPFGESERMRDGVTGAGGQQGGETDSLTE